MVDITTSITLPSLPKNEDDYSDWQGQLAARNYNFATQIDQIIINTEQKLLNVIASSIDELVKQAQTPTAKGGKMRVDTGFLRNSGIASLNAPPVGQTVGRRRNAGETSKPLPDYVWIQHLLVLY